MITSKQQRGIIIRIISLVAIMFGVMTIKEGGMVLFGDGAARTAAGNYVPFVLWFNFISGFAYVFAGAGLWLQQRWAVWLAISIAGAIIVTFLAFGAHVYSGGSYEKRTVIAMTLRALIWLAIATTAARALRHG